MCGVGLRLSLTQGQAFLVDKFSRPFSHYLVELGTNAMMPTKSQASEVQESAAFVTRTVLVVDDDISVRHLVAAGLRRRGYRILAAGNGLQALQIAERHPGRIDALVTDLNMPYLCGPEVANRLTAVRPQLRVLFMSGCVPEGRAATELLATGGMLLQKPFTLDELWRKLQESLRRNKENLHTGSRENA